MKQPLFLRQYPLIKDILLADPSVGKAYFTQACLLDVTTLMLFLEAGINMDCLSDLEQQRLAEQLLQQKEQEKINWLLHYGANPALFHTDHRLSIQQAPFCYINGGQIALFEQWLLSTPDIYVRSLDGETILQFAERKKKIDMVKLIHQYSFPIHQVLPMPIWNEAEKWWQYVANTIATRCLLPVATVYEKMIMAHLTAKQLQHTDHALVAILKKYVQQESLTLAELTPFWQKHPFQEIVHCMALSLQLPVDKGLVKTLVAKKYAIAYDALLDAMATSPKQATFVAQGYALRAPRCSLVYIQLQLHHCRTLHEKLQWNDELALLMNEK